MPKKKYRLRPARTRDLEAIFFIERQCFPSPWSSTLFFYELQKPYACLWVLESKGKVWGYICFWVIADEVHLANLAVLPEVRRQGLASFMLRVMLRYAKRKGAQRVLLEVRENNQAAQALYAKFGFKLDGRRKRYYTDTGEDALLLSLTLGGGRGASRKS